MQHSKEDGVVLVLADVSTLLQGDDGLRGLASEADPVGRILEMALECSPKTLLIDFFGASQGSAFWTSLDPRSEHVRNLVPALLQFVLNRDWTCEAIPICPNVPGMQHEGPIPVPIRPQSVFWLVKDGNEDVSVPDVTSRFGLPAPSFQRVTVSECAAPRRLPKDSNITHALLSCLEAVSAAAVPTTRFANVILGGTFDHLHAGHILLLSSSVLSCAGRLHIGISGDALLRNKSFAAQLEPFERRAEGVRRVVLAMNPHIDLNV